jgi:hypothetical protein
VENINDICASIQYTIVEIDGQIKISQKKPELTKSLSVVVYHIWELESYKKDENKSMENICSKI